MGDIYRSITEENISEKPRNKTYTLTNNHHTIETLVQTSGNYINNEIKIMQHHKFKYLFNERKRLSGLKSRDDIIITSADKAGNTETLYNNEKLKQLQTKWSNKTKQWNCPKCNSKIPKGKSIKQKYCQKYKYIGPKYPIKYSKRGIFRETCHKLRDLSQIKNVVY